MFVLLQKSVICVQLERGGTSLVHRCQHGLKAGVRILWSPLSLTGRQPVLVVTETLAARMPGHQNGLSLRPGLPCSLIARFQGCVQKERERQKLCRQLVSSLKSHTTSPSSHSVCHGKCSETGSRLQLVMEWQGSEEDGDQEYDFSHFPKCIMP